MNYESSIKNNIITYRAWLFLCTFFFSASLFSANENRMIEKGDRLKDSIAMIEQESDKVSIKITRPSGVNLAYEPKDIFFKIPYQNEAISFEYFLNFLKTRDAEHQAQLKAILTTFFNDNEDLSTFNYGGMYSVKYNDNEDLSTFHYGGMHPVEYNNTKTGIIFTARIRVPKHK